MNVLAFLLILLTSASTATSQSANPQLFLLNILSYLNEYFVQNDILDSGVTQEVLNGTNSSMDPLEVLINLYAQLETIQNVTKKIRSLNNECISQLNLFLNGLLNMDEWAKEMFDATAKIQSGILEGNVMHMGNYDECMGINVFTNGTQISGKYCTAVIGGKGWPPVELDNHGANLVRMKLSYGVCVPAACNKTTLEEIAGLLEEALKAPFEFRFVEELCESTITPKPFSIAAILSVFFFGTVGVIILLSTLYDIYGDKKRGTRSSLFIAFSFYTNGKKLFSTKASADSLECLNGMRVISMIWIVGCHRFMYSQMLPLINMYFAMQWTEKLESVLITSGNMAVDTFFVISGLLVVYVYLNHKEKGNNMSIAMFYFHRILRLTPSLAALVLFYATLLKHIGSGPLWPIMYSFFQETCERNWWSTLLYLQNYIEGPEETCVGHAWYLAVDTQLYFLSPLLLFPLMKWPKSSILGICVLIFLSGVYNFEIVWQKEVGNTFYGISPDGMAQVYFATQGRAAPWLIGVILGYIIFQCRNKIIRIHKIAVVLMWLLSMGTMAGITLYHHRLLDSDLLEMSLFTSMARAIWAFGLSVIIFLCTSGHGGFVNAFLSSSIFKVLIRLNYSMYLLHISVIVFLICQTRTPGYLLISETFYIFWGDFMITLGLSIIWTLSFESPVLMLEKLIFGKKRKPAVVQTEPRVLNNNNNINVIVIQDNLGNSAKIQ